MRVLLIGNYTNSRQQSMQRYAELLRHELEAAGYEVKLVHPPALLGRLHGSDTAVAKWIGYIDRFILYPALLRLQVGWADIIHICDQANSLYIPYLRHKAHIITCHDMLAIRAALGEIPESVPSWTGRIYQDWILRNLRKAQTIVCVSEQTREDVARLLDLTSNRLVVVPNALNYPYRPMCIKEANERLRSLDIDPDKPFLLHVGGNAWYKNRGGVIRIFCSLTRRHQFRDCRLIMAGEPCTAEMRALIATHGLSDKILELIDVSNEDLRALYTSAQALLFPSLQEGFGWPIIEAQACGCPVITTRRLPMTEVSGGAAIYIEPEDADRAASQIESCWALRSRLTQEGLVNAGRYTPEKMMAGYVAAYRDAMANANNTVVS